MLLTALASSSEDELLRRWLADDDKSWVRPKEARGAVVRKEARARKRMEEQGVETPEASVEEVGRDIYDLLSRPRTIDASASPSPARSTCVYSPTAPIPARRCGHVT